MDSCLRESRSLDFSIRDVVKRAIVFTYLATNSTRSKMPRPPANGLIHGRMGAFEENKRKRPSMALKGEFKDIIDILSSAPFEEYSGKLLVKKEKRLKASRSSCSRTIKSMKEYPRERRDMRRVHREQLEIDNKSTLQ